ncbi:MAG: hypothetical protein KGI58_03640 [Patescibacteria group bacterium]|nr:hypothetical protein [Patescibacteria group bacterium]
MITTIIIFFIAITVAFGMLMYKAWEIRTMRASIQENSVNNIPNISFRHIEKNMLYITKHIVQSIVLVVVKYWFIFITRIKKWFSTNWPKAHNYFKKKSESTETVKKPTFLRRAVLESQAKIKRIKEKVQEEHEENTPL